MVREQAEEKEVRKGMRLGKYELGRTLGEGNFGKVKFAKDTVSGQPFAVKIIDKSRIADLNFSLQIKREIRTLKMLKHPNIVRLHEVLASKTKINMVMELVTGGELFDKIVRIHFLVPQAKLTHECKFKLKSHFDISQEDGLLHTTCGSPNYVAPEVLANRGYEGAASDIWSCGVVLYVILTGCLPFDDRNLVVLYQKICKGDPPIPRWLSPGARTMIKKMLDPNPVTRITVAGIKASEWFKHEYIPSVPDDDDDEEDIDTDDDAFSVQEVGSEDGKGSDSPTIINAFQLIGMSSFLDLSGFFEQENVSERRIRFTSNSSAKDLLEKIENSVTEMGFSVQKKNAKLKVKQEEHNQKGQVGLSVTAEVFEIKPSLNVVELRKSYGDSSLYRQLYERLLKEVGTSSPEQELVT
ncbi:hypothetical protein DY000_02050251 [Brassica cretica]|uniref:non-specific serine/threonine protein kinase n=1 Tax=Brassica cretica TaxID=69181 RepID=A0ABQ7EZV5_BRACR|nr:hypothetical protein DY000_02050251 [Brassica cretica]